MAGIRAIETRYKGCRFRSRLEARWAVFLDALGVRWEYEPEGFVLGGESYLPDFFLPFPEPVLVGRESKVTHWDGWRQTQAYWLEIKPVAPSERERGLMLALASHTRHHVYCFAGNPWPGELQIYTAMIQGDWHDCIAHEKEFEAEMAGIRREIDLPPPSPLDDVTRLWFCLHGFACNLQLPEGREALYRAFCAARSARFEHGETPRV